MSRILIIEDELGLQITLTDFLESEGFEVKVKGEGISGQAEAETGGWDLILLDVMLPGRDGFQICQNLREGGIVTPILMLTARGTNIDTVMGLRLGADDYLTKPFDTQILLARIKALIRRASRILSPSEKHTEGSFSFGEFVLDTVKGELCEGESPVELNSQEYRLLLYLLKNTGRVLTRDELLDGVWGYEQVTTTRTVDVHIAWLRQKLGEQSRPGFIQTVRGRGYKFVGGPDHHKSEH
ncbi:MAG: response regulator transcription factor [Spirochaetales bacterium]|nr:response regulator transcription factor [Spirochaetales bacterium]